MLFRFDELFRVGSALIRTGPFACTSLICAADMRDTLLPAARRLGVGAGAAVAILSLMYACALTVGLFKLPSPEHQIQQPWFFIMEVLIIGIAPAMVALTVAVHASVSPDRKAHALAGVAFMTMSAGLTCAVHFAILTLNRQPAFASEPWARLVFSFEWPSIAYALDILAWDLLFSLGALFAAAAIQGSGRVRVARGLLFASATLAFLGLAGVPLADMQIRNIGIIGYAVLFPIASGVLAFHFHRAAPDPRQRGG